MYNRLLPFVQNLRAIFVMIILTNHFYFALQTAVEAITDEERAGKHFTISNYNC